MNENEQTELCRFRPERFEFRRIDKQAVDLGGDDHARKTKFVRASRQFLESRRSAQRMHMRGADEPSRIIAFGLLRLVVDEFRPLEIDAHAGAAGDEGRVDARDVHHADVLVEIVEQLVRGVARRAGLIENDDEFVAEVLLEQFTRREVVLEVDDNAFPLDKT